MGEERNIHVSNRWRPLRGEVQPFAQDCGDALLIKKTAKRPRRRTKTPKSKQVGHVSPERRSRNVQRKKRNARAPIGVENPPRNPYCPARQKASDVMPDEGLGNGAPTWHQYGQLALCSGVLFFLRAIHASNRVSIRAMIELSACCWRGASSRSVRGKAS
jgi:hypothetical protein